MIIALLTGAILISFGSVIAVWFLGIKKRHQMEVRLRAAAGDWARELGWTATGHAPAIFRVRYDRGRAGSWFPRLVVFDTAAIVLVTFRPRRITQRAWTKDAPPAVYRERGLWGRINVQSESLLVDGRQLADALAMAGWLPEG